MKVDSTVTLTVVIALVALISPIFVTLINNIHHTKIRKLELNHDLKLKTADTYYSDKKDAFTNFLNAAGKMRTFVSDFSTQNKVSELKSAAEKVMLFCTNETELMISQFICYVEEYTKAKYSEEDDLTFDNLLSSIADSFNQELSELRNNTEI